MPGKGARSKMASPRRPRDQTFRKTDLVRAIKAAQAAGLVNPHVEIDRFGTIKIIPGEPLGSADSNPWLDEVKQ
jgi:arginine exporter protein ArgO